MKYSFLSIVFFAVCTQLSFAQVLPAARAVDWKSAGLRYNSNPATTLDLSAFGAVGDGLSPNDAALSAALAALGANGGIIEIPDGNYLFNSTIQLTDNVILRGNGVANTQLTLSLGGAGDGISIAGTASSDTTALSMTVLKGEMGLEVYNAAAFQSGDFIQIHQNDSAWLNNNWAYGMVGQIVKIDSIVNNFVYIDAALRMDYDIIRSPFIRRLNMRQGVGIECLRVERMDATATQTANIYFGLAANCWVRGIESENCNFSHITAQRSSRIEVAQSYFHHAFDYGGGGKGYGVMLQFCTGDCRIEDNFFEHLRHSMILQAGSNGNVFAYNYSIDPNRTEFPSNAAGDIVLHGNYPYCNLFEQNIAQHISIDNSHGANGMYNTFFRNRAEGYGIWMTAANSPSQNFIGNESLGTFFILQGADNFEHGNYYNSAITPAGTNTLADISYGYNAKPLFVPNTEFAAIGTPNTAATASIPAKYRKNNNAIFLNSCGAYAIPEVSFAQAALSYNEAAGTASIPINISYIRPIPTTVSVLVAASSTATDSDDYNLSAYSVTFPAGTNSPQLLDITINNDTLTEAAETVVLILQDTSAAVTLGIDTLVVMLLDDEINGITTQENTPVFRIYPNPTRSFLTVELQEKSDEIAIFDVAGRRVYQVFNPTDGILKIDVSGWEAGAYIIKVKQNKQVYMKPFVKQ